MGAIGFSVLQAYGERSVCILRRVQVCLDAHAARDVMEIELTIVVCVWFYNCRSNDLRPRYFLPASYRFACFSPRDSQYPPVRAVMSKAKITDPNCVVSVHL